MQNGARRKTQELLHFACPCQKNNIATYLLQHFEVFDFHLSLLSTIPGAMAQISPCQPQTQEGRKMLAKIQGIHANPKLTLKVVDVGIVKNMLMLL